MNIEKSSSQTRAELASTSSIREQVLDGFRASKEYRHAFVEESIRSHIAAQIRALQDEKKWDYRTFAEKMNRKASWVYRLEDPNAPPPTIPTLLQVAEAFDVGLDVRFRAFSEFLDEVTTLRHESFLVPSFEEELKNGAFLQVKRRRRIRGSRLRRRSQAEKRPSQADGPNVIGASAQQPLALAS